MIEKLRRGAVWEGATGGRQAGRPAGGAEGGGQEEE